MKVKEEDLERELKIAIEGKDPQPACAKRLGMRLSRFNLLLARARVHGVQAVLHSNMPKGYTDSFKLDVVHSAIVEGASITGCCVKYNLTHQTVVTWIRKYKAGGESLLLEDNRGRKGMGRKKKPKLEDYEPGSMEYLKLKVELLERENQLLKKVLPLVQEKIRSRSQGKSGTSSSEN